jgi:hypothetical protein
VVEEAVLHARVVASPLALHGERHRAPRERARPQTRI